MGQAGLMTRVPPEAGRALDGGRYRVVEVLSEAEKGGVYRVLDEGGQGFLVEEVVIPEGEDPQPLQAAVERVRSLGHPALVPVVGCFLEHEACYVVLKAAEGEVLRAGRALPVNPLFEAVEKLCEGLQLLFGSTGEELPLDLSPHSWIWGQEGPQLARYGWYRWFERGPANLAARQQELGQVIYLLLTGEPWSPGAPALSPELSWFLQRCLSGDPARCYSSFTDLGLTLCSYRQARDSSGPLRLESAAPPRARYRPTEVPEPRRAFWRWWWLALVLLLTAGWAWLARLSGGADFPPVVEPAAALAGSTEVQFWSAQDGTLLSTYRAGEEVADLASVDRESLLLASLPKSRRLALLEPSTGRVLGYLALDCEPRSLESSSDDRTVFVAHPAQAMVSVVELVPSPRRRFPLRLKGVIPTEAAPSMAGGHGNLFVHSVSQHVVVGHQLSPPRMLGRLSYALPGTEDQERHSTLVLSPFGKLVYLARPGGIKVLDACSLRQVGLFKATGGHDPVLLLQAGQWLLCLHRSGELGIIEETTGTLRTALNLEGAPLDATVRGFQLWVLVSPDRVVQVDTRSQKVQRSWRTSIPIHALCFVAGGR